MAKGKKPNVSKFIAIIIICIVGSAGATYFIINKNNQTDIDSYKIEISELNKKINNQNECFRYFAKASIEVEGALLNHGVAETYTKQGSEYYGLNIYDVSEYFYNLSTSYYNLTVDFFKESITQLNQAKKYAKNEELLNAVIVENVDTVRILLEKGANVDAKTNNGRTALIEVSARGRTDIVKMLIDKGADVNAKDNDGGTALTFAPLSISIFTISIYPF